MMGFGAVNSGLGDTQSVGSWFVRVTGSRTRLKWCSLAYFLPGFFDDFGADPASINLILQISVFWQIVDGKLLPMWVDYWALLQLAELAV